MGRGGNRTITKHNVNDAACAIADLVFDCGDKDFIRAVRDFVAELGVGTHSGGEYRIIGVHSREENS